MEIQKQAFMHRWYNELWNNSNENVIDEMLHPDCKAYGLGAEPIYGREQFRLFYKAFRTAYTDIRVIIEKNFIDGDYLISLCGVKGTHQDTGKPIDILGTSIARIEDGQIVEAWNCFDFLTMNLQTGKINADQLV